MRFKSRKLLAICLVACTLFSTSVSANENIKRTNPTLDEQRQIFKEFAEKHPSSNAPFPRSHKGGVLVTEDSSICPQFHFIGHVGILTGVNSQGECKTVESNPGPGVHFDNPDAWEDKDTCYVLDSGYGSKYQCEALDWCKEQIGKPYNPNYFDREKTDAFYCSQLIWAGYRYGAGIDLCPGAWNAVYPSDILKSTSLYCIWGKNWVW